MTQHKPVLTNEEMHALICGNPSTLGLSIARLKDFIRQVEKAVIDKLAEQEPVVYRFLPPGTQQYMYITDDVPKIKEFEPLYAHPPMLTDHIADVSKMVGSDHIADMRKKVPDGWQLVPKDPTHAMLDKMQSFEGAGVYVIYYAALEASPKYAGDSDDQ